MFFVWSVIKHASILCYWVKNNKTVRIMNEVWWKKKEQINFASVNSDLADVACNTLIPV